MHITSCSNINEFLGLDNNCNEKRLSRPTIESEDVYFESTKQWKAIKRPSIKINQSINQ